MRKIGFSELDASFVPDVVFNDPYWQQCIDLSLRSKGEDQRFGSLVMLGGEVIGEGWNRLLGRNEPFPFRASMFLRAEQAAIGAAILNFGEEKLRGAIICVSGFFVKERRPIIFRRPTFTCTICAKLYPRYGLNYSILTPDGRVVIDGETTYREALQHQNVRRDQNLTAKELRLEISL